MSSRPRQSRPRPSAARVDDRTRVDDVPGFVSPWAHGSALYRRMVLTGSGLFLLGIVLAVTGATTHRIPLSHAALVVLGLGVVVHLSAQLVRFREAARRQGGLQDR